MTLKDIITDVQSYLHDDGVVWSRAELLRWANDAYHELLYSSAAVTRPYQTDLPGRTAAAFTQLWELNIHPGTYRVFTRSPANRPLRVTYTWEVQALEGIAPAQSYAVTTQLWEEAYSSDTDAHSRIALPRQSDRPVKIYWDTKRLAHTSIRELDMSYWRWWRDAGEPIGTMPGIGPEKSLEIYLLQTNYIQSYKLDAFEVGTPRQFSSDAGRQYAVSSGNTDWTYAYTSSVDSGFVPGTGLLIAMTPVATGERGTFSWEADLTTTTNDTNSGIPGTVYTHVTEELDAQLAAGIARHLSSEDRQYLGVAYDSGQDLTGIPRRFASADDAITVWTSIVPDRSFTEYDEPDLLPDQFAKYIKFKVLSSAFSRKGEGYRPDLAQHWEALFRLGVGLLAMLGTPSVLDRVYAREQIKDASIQAPPRVRFPATFPHLP